MVSSSTSSATFLAFFAISFIARLVIAPKPPVTAISIPNFIPPFITLNLSILSYKAFNVIFAAPGNSRPSFIPSKIDAKIAVLASS